MTDSAKVLFHLLRLAAGKEAAGKSPADSADFCADWQEVYRLAAEQGVLAVAFDGVRRLRESGMAESLDEDLYYTWLGQVVLHEQKCQHHRMVIAEFARRCAEHHACLYVLKGVAFGLNYPVPEHRPCGDIDIFLVRDDGSPAYEVGNAVAREMGAVVDTGWYKHSQIHIAGVMFENHEYLVCTRESHRHKELNVCLSGMLFKATPSQHLPGSLALIPPVEFNALFQAYHSMSHFTADGICLRHVLDWATFVQRYQQELDWPRFYADCKVYRFDRFVTAMTDIAVHKLGVEVTNPAIVCESAYTERILESIFNDTDAKVFGTPGGAWNHRCRLVQNTFKYAWKYSEIAQVSPLRHVWSSITGYFLHTEN